MQIQKTPYIAYELNGWHSEIDRVPLGDRNIEVLLNMLEFGENLYDVIPQLDKEMFSEYPLNYCLFELRDEVDIDNIRFISSEGHKPVGKLIVPHYRIKTRDEIKSELNKSNDSFEKEKYLEALGKNRDADRFFSKGIFNYVPYNPDKILILSENQL